MRKLGKGGRANAMFIQAAAEDLPLELDGIAGEIRINFPWGSLLRAVLLPDDRFLRRLRKILVPGGVLEIVTGLDPERDRCEIERLGIEPLSGSRIEAVIAPSYERAGLNMLSFETSTALDLDTDTTWARKLKGSTKRMIVRLVFGADR